MSEPAPPRQIRRVGVTIVVLGALGFATVSCASGSSASGVNHSPSAAAGGGGALVDGCVLGTWVATSVTTTFSAPGALVTLRGGAGLKLTFHADGSETADWSSMAPLTTNVPVDVTQTYKGTSTYHVSTQDGVLQFLSEDYSNWSGQQDFGGQASALTGPSPIPPESYSCTSGTFTEQNQTWLATFTRS